jgi:uncharacterized protein YaeQ
MLMSVVQVHLSPPETQKADPGDGVRFFLARPISPPFMAIKSTIFKANLQIADIDHGYYADHALTLARHPSETDERMMVRLVAMAIHAHELQDTCRGDGTLTFGAGLSDPDDPDVSLTDYTGRKRIWIEVGQPEDKPVS